MVTTRLTPACLGSSPIVLRLFGSFSAGSSRILATVSSSISALNGALNRYALTTETALVRRPFLGGKLRGARWKVSLNVGRTRFSNGSALARWDERIEPVSGLSGAESGTGPSRGDWGAEESELARDEASEGRLTSGESDSSEPGLPSGARAVGVAIGEVGVIVVEGTVGVCDGTGLGGVEKLARGAKNDHELVCFSVRIGPASAGAVVEDENCESDDGTGDVEGRSRDADLDELDEAESPASKAAWLIIACALSRWRRRTSSSGDSPQIVCSHERGGGADRKSVV